jgi:hypothetical protein
MLTKDDYNFILTQFPVISDRIQQTIRQREENEARKKAEDAAKKAEEERRKAEEERLMLEAEQQRLTLRLQSPSLLLQSFNGRRSRQSLLGHPMNASQASSLNRSYQNSNGLFGRLFQQSSRQPSKHSLPEEPLKRDP